jgi:IclR family mhp operon transcriptional activator
MYLRDTSRRFSPLSIDRVTVGHRCPMLISGTGRVYLSYCPEQEREKILEMLRRSNDQFDRLVNKPGYVETFIEETLRQGYGARCNRYIYDDRTVSVAVPVRIGPRVLGTIGITGIASAINAQQLAKRHMKALLAAREKLELGIQNIRV